MRQGDPLASKQKAVSAHDISKADRPVLPERITRLSWLARARLFWERYAPLFALPALAVSLFLVATLLGVWDVLGDPVRLLLLGGTLLLLGRAIWRARLVRVPTRSDALRRLENTAGLSHRPLDTLQDVAVLSPALWPTHAKKAEREAKSIRKVGRFPALSPIDRYGLRIIMPLILALAVFLSLGYGGERLRRGLTPGWLPFTNPQSLSFEAWVDPPDYTGRPPTYAQGSRLLNAPEGSTVVVRVSGTSDLPRPRWWSEGGRDSFLDVNGLGESSAEVRHIVDGTGTLEWRMGWRREAWTVQSIPDAEPTIEILEAPEADKQDRLVLRFSAADDYDVDRLVLDMIELSDDLDPETVTDAQMTPFDTETAPFKSAEDRTLKLDMTRHPLAGRKVMARLVAIDGAGQRGRSEPIYFTVPDKIFVEPLAKAIIEQRGLLVAGLADEAGYAPAPTREADADASDGSFDTYQTAWRLGRAPEPIQRATQLMDAVTLYPDPGAFGDPVVYMGLRHASKSLRYARSAEALSGLPEHMWRLAMRAEFGVLGTALQEMQAAEAALRDGIARRAPEREVDTLFERYNQAVENYMEELRRNATVAEGGEGGGQPMGSTDEIEELLKAIEEANARGDTEGARQALAQLAELLENMQIQLSQSGGGGGEGEPSSDMSEEMAENLEDLAESLADQRELEDRTRQAQREELARDNGDEDDGDGETGEGEEGSDTQAGEGPGENEGQAETPEALAERQGDIESLIEGLQERLTESGDAAASGPRSEDGQSGAGEEQGDQPGAGVERGDASTGGGGIDGDPNDPRRGGGGSDEQFAENNEGSSSDALERAQDAMRRSREALEAGDLAEARRAQREAVEALRDAGDSLSREAMADANERGEGEDPLGRNQNGFNNDLSETDLSEQDNATRSREIQEELRRRASEAERDAQERDYLDRLLKRY
jgi:hypothetical protein